MSQVLSEVELASLRQGVWRRAVREAGSAGLTPGGVSDRLRRRARGPEPVRTAHVYLPSAVFRDAIEHFRRAGTPHRAEPLSALAFRDPAVTHAVLALVHAAETGAPDLYAASVAQYLATHLLSRLSAWGSGAEAAISKFHFVRLFRAATGETPHAYVVRAEGHTPE